MRSVALSVLVFGLACAPVEDVTIPADSQNIAGVNGTVEFISLEGGCWAIQVDNATYQPTNLANEFKQDGLRVRVTMRRLDNVASVCMIGPVVQIYSIARR